MRLNFEITTQGNIKNSDSEGISSAIQWLRCCTSNAGGCGSIPGQGTRDPAGLVSQPKKESERTTEVLFLEAGSLFLKSSAV